MVVSHKSHSHSRRFEPQMCQKQVLEKLGLYAMTTKLRWGICSQAKSMIPVEDSPGYTFIFPVSQS